MLRDTPLDLPSEKVDHVLNEVEAVVRYPVTPARNDGGQRAAWKLTACQILMCRVDTVNMYGRKIMPTAGTRSSCH